MIFGPAKMGPHDAHESALDSTRKQSRKIGSKSAAEAEALLVGAGDYDTKAPTDATNFFNLAMSHYGLNDLPATLAALEQALERDSSLIEAQLYRGTVLERMQRSAPWSATILGR